MQIDIQGRVRNTKLPVRHGLMPLYEAVVNSVHAIQEIGEGDGLIRVGIERSWSLLATDAHGNTLPEIIAFTVTDNGAGFSEDNYRSFETMDSLRKAALGGKGVGRLLWLKAFTRVSVRSTYQEGGKWWDRQFKFVLTPSGVEEHTLHPINGQPRVRETRVHLIDFHERYRESCPKSAQAIGRRVVEHCLQYFLLENMPRVVLEDPECGETIDLSELYHAEFRPQSERRSFAVGGQEFDVMNVLLKTAGETEHAIHFCANGRVVQSTKLSTAIPHLDRPLIDGDGSEVVYWGCVTSELLDKRVDSDRTGFDLDHEGDVGLFGGVSWEAVERAALEEVRSYLAPRTKEAQETAFQRVRDYIEQTAPKYRPLLTHRRAGLERLSGGLSDDKLDLELHQLMNNWRHEVRVAVSNNLQSIPDDATKFDEYRDTFVRLLGEVEEVAKSDLTEYVVTRAAVLRFFEKLLGSADDGKFAREDALHDLFFPRRSTSTEVDYNRHNLWVLDERLAYHQFLASDLPFSQLTAAPVAVDSKDRPDILIYNHPLAFSPGEAPVGSVVIVEFKRPERDDYTDEENPIRQVIDYIKQIRAGKARRRDGSTVAPPPEGTPFYCYVVASLTPKLRDTALSLSFTEAPDRQGFFHYNPNFKAYIEVSDYRKVLDDARKRNRAFFDQLGIQH